MARRQTKNRTNIERISGVPIHDAFLAFVCVKCSKLNTIHLGDKLLTPKQAFDSESWECSRCSFVHKKDADLPTSDHNGDPLPYSKWDKKIIKGDSVSVERFWKAFFTMFTENKEAYWKQCNACGRKLPSNAFSRHKGWGPLEKQMECRSCKAVINANLNPKRTKEQLHESSSRRRTADLLLKGDNEKINFQDLFDRFDSRCFKTGKALDINKRKTWAIDHILPSRWLYPLTKENAALLSKEANDNKRDKWPSEFYTNNELKKLSKITGINLELISRKTPIANQDIDVDAFVDRVLNVRKSTDISKRIKELKKIIDENELSEQLSEHNKKILGY